MSTIAGEVKNPQVIPKGTLITIPLIMAVYILPTIAGLGSLGQWDNWGTEAGTVGYSDVVQEFWGPAFGVFFVLVAIFAQCSIFNTYIASGSRGFFSLADDNLAPPVLVKCDKKHGVPYIAVLTVAISTMILCMLPFGFVIILDVHMLSLIHIYKGSMGKDVQFSLRNWHMDKYFGEKKMNLIGGILTTAMIIIGLGIMIGTLVSLLGGVA